MELINEFSVAAPVSDTWPLLTDIERIAPCVPGFQLKDSTDGEHRGTIKVKVGAVQTTYDCVIRFVELDEQAYRAVIAAEGREKQGQGGVRASITSTLEPEDGGTRARVVTDLNVTGRVAQFGRGVLADVADRLTKQFVKRLESELLTPVAPEDPPAGQHRDEAPAGQRPDEAPAGQRPERPDEAGARREAPPEEEQDDAIDLLGAAGGPLVKRLVPVVVVLALLALLVGRVRSR